MASIELQSIVKAYGDQPAVIRNVDLSVREGEFCVFVGPSGCGKSTLLRMIAGLEDISVGNLLIDSVRMNDIPPSRRGVAMVFQSYALFPHLSVYENMAFGMTLARVDKATIREKVTAADGQGGLADHGDSVLIAREPTSFSDRVRRRRQV